MALYCKAENKIWVEVGYGLEGILPDSKIGALLDEYYVPLRDAGNVSEGIIGFMKKSSEIVNKNREEVLSGNTGKGFSEGEWDSVLLFIFILFFVVILPIINAIKSNTGKNKSLVYEEEKSGIHYQGVKEIKIINRIGFLTIIFFIGCLFFGYIVAGIIIFVVGLFVLVPLAKLLIGVRCEKDGLRMKKIKKKGNHIYYKCPKGHIGWVLAGALVSGSGWLWHGANSGGFGGGGFGGGGFGGGMSGGGGAGR